MKAIYKLLQPVDFVIVGIYLIILIAIAYWVSFVQKKNKNENLFLANRSLG
jgi:solute:Na+ symporter, SSS family